MILIFNLEINISVLLAVKSSFINSWWKRVRLLLEVDSKGKKTSSSKESIERCFGLGESSHCCWLLREVENTDFPGGLHKLTLGKCTRQPPLQWRAEPEGTERALSA